MPVVSAFWVKSKVCSHCGAAFATEEELYEHFEECEACLQVRAENADVHGDDQ